MSLQNWILLAISMITTINICSASLIIEEDTWKGADREKSVSAALETESDRMIHILKSYLQDNPNKHLKGFFENLEGCLLDDKKEESKPKPEFVFSSRPENQCVELGETCTRSGNFRDFKSEKDIEITIGEGNHQSTPPRPPQRPSVSTRCCNHTLCRSQKCCIPTASTAESPACHSNDDCCDSGICDTEFSLLCKVPSQGQCTKDEQCIKRSCQSGICCIGTLDSCHICQDSNDCCGKGSCVGGKCLATNGDYCNNDNQCSSGTCCSSNVCGLPTPTPSNLPPGTLQKCKTSADCCGTGLCETTSGTCRYPDASPCTKDFECIHNSCFGGKCCFDTNYGHQCVDAKTYCCNSQAICKTSSVADTTISICGKP